MRSGQGRSTGGIGASTLLGITFIVLKLCHRIEWSWWWVLAPFWVPVACVVLLLGSLVVAVVLGSYRR